VFAGQSKAALEYAGGDWDLFIYVMTFVDRVSHPYWAYTHPEGFPTLDKAKAEKFAYAVPSSYKRSDEELGKILAKAKGTPYVLVVSDHGFQSSSDPNKPIGAHNPNGIYLLAGPDITKKEGQPKFIEDVTPTILYLMGLPVAQDMDGKPFAEVTEMIGRKPATIPSYEVAQRDATDQPVDGDTWESLKGLGYVDGAPPRAADRKKAEDAAAAAEKKQKAAMQKQGGATGQKPGANAAPGQKAGDAMPGQAPGGAAGQKPGDAMPGQKPGGAAGQKPGGAAGQKPGDAAGQKRGDAMPGQNQGANAAPGQKPGENAAGVAPGEKPAAGAPGEKPSAASPGEKPAAGAPGAKAGTVAPAEKGALEDWPE
jgi:hypothetical protein